MKTMDISGETSCKVRLGPRRVILDSPFCFKFKFSLLQYTIRVGYRIQQRDFHHLPTAVLGLGRFHTFRGLPFTRVFQQTHA